MIKFFIIVSVMLIGAGLSGGLQAQTLMVKKRNTQSQRRELLEEAETLFADQHAIAPLFHWNSPYIKSGRIREIATSPGGGILLERFKKE